MIDPTSGVPPPGVSAPSVAVSASTWAVDSDARLTFGAERTPHSSSTLKKLRPTEVFGTAASVRMAFAIADVITDHFVGWVASAVTAVCSHVTESVMGGRLQFMLPDR